MDVTMTSGSSSVSASGAGCQIRRVSYFPRRFLEGSWMGNEQDKLGAALKACAAGDRKGLAVIYESEAARMVTVAQRILRRHDLAEEIVQEAFLQIWNKAWQYDPSRGSARGWIYAIVRSRSLNALRDGGREDLTETDKGNLAYIAGITVIDLIVAGAPVMSPALVAAPVSRLTV